MSLCGLSSYSYLLTRIRAWLSSYTYLGTCPIIMMSSYGLCSYTLLIDSGFVGRKIFCHHHIRPLVRSQEERRRLFEEPTKSHISPSILQYTKNTWWYTTLGGFPEEPSSLLVSTPRELIMELSRRPHGVRTICARRKKVPRSTCPIIDVS